MTAINPRGGRDCAAGIADRLMAEFRRALPLSLISQVVLRARDELSGQIPDGAFPEMLERLSRTRLTHLQLELIG